MQAQRSEPRSSVALKVSDKWNQFLNSIDSEAPAETEGMSIGEWAEKTPIILDGRPFTFERHEYLREPYQDDHPFVVEVKAAQLGLTTKAILKSFTGRDSGTSGGFCICSPAGMMS